MRVLRALLVLLACVFMQSLALAAGISVRPAQDGLTSVSCGYAHPIVFEVGTLGLPWRCLDATNSKGKLEWQVRKDRSYQVWNAEDYALSQLNEARRALGKQGSAPKAILPAVIDALKWVTRQRAIRDNESLLMSQMRLSSAMQALLGIRIDIEAGVGLKVWPEYDLNASASFRCESKRVRAKLSSLQMPDTWKVLKPLDTHWFSAAPGDLKSARTQVRIPPDSTLYLGNSPIIAEYDVDYRGVKFKAWNAADAELVAPIQKDASIRTVSDTEIEYNVRLTSLLPIKGVATSLDLPEGWTGTVPTEKFDLSLTKDLTYKIKKPKDDACALKIIGARFSFASYVTSKRLLTDHSLRIAERTSTTGLKMVQPKGEEAPLVTISDRGCRQFPNTGSMYFDISENFLPGNETCILLECAGASPGTILVEYGSAGGTLNSTEPQPVDQSRGWQQLVFVLKDARFDESFPGGADIRVRGTGSLALSRICISRFRISTQAPPVLKRG